MFRIRRVFDDSVQVNREAIIQVQAILRSQFAELDPHEAEKLPQQLRDPMKHRFRPILFVAENARRVIRAFALMLHAPDLNFCYLDYLSVAPGRSGRGLGGILYEQVRGEARALGVVGLFFECLPDDAHLSRDAETRRQNAARLRFYEYYGVRPVVNTRYETPVRPGGDNPPYLMFDELGTGRRVGAAQAREIVRAILERKYAHICPRAYVDDVVASFVDDPIRLREPRYLSGPVAAVPAPGIPESRQIVLIVNEGHHVHHVQDRGYVESPVRIASILKAIEPTGLFRRIPAKSYPEAHILDVHAREYVEYFKRLCKHLPADRPVYPYVFPIRNQARPPKILSMRAGYFCIDTFTPLTGNAYLAARGAVNCALTGAQALLEGERAAYALVRPPGHHAERKAFGGFCYFNASAIAAHYLSRHGKVAILDIDYHHGNGQEEIFYERSDVLTVSIHGHPNFAYPYFSGFRDSRGSGIGVGFNLNLALPERVDGERYRDALRTALGALRKFNPEFLVVAFGLDTAKNDPTGSWLLRSRDFGANGELVGSLGYKTLIVQEGGYDNRVIGSNARAFFEGFHRARFAVANGKPHARAIGTRSDPASGVGNVRALDGKAHDDKPRA